MGTMLSQVLGLVAFVGFVAALGLAQNTWRWYRSYQIMRRRAAMRRHPAGKRVGNV